MDKEMLPPWLAHPSIPLGSAGWRMGHGEKYWYEFVAWFSALSAVERESYKHRYPKPDSWKLFWPYVPEKIDEYLAGNA
jgi:hypothetical protein